MSTSLPQLVGTRSLPTICGVIAEGGSPPFEYFTGEAPGTSDGEPLSAIILSVRIW